jgi:ribosomal protein S14
MVNYLNFRDKRRRQRFRDIEGINFLLSGVLNDNRIGFSTRFILKSRCQQRVLKLNKYSVSHIRGRCRQTGRSRFVLRFFGLSRSTLRSRFSGGSVSGFIKK